jgi:hypothetical protein
MPDPATVGFPTQSTPIDTFKDVDGQFSSKRIAAFGALSLYALGFFADTFTHFHAPEHVMDGLMYFAAAVLGLAASERFAPKRD